MSTPGIGRALLLIAALAGACFAPGVARAGPLPPDAAPTHLEGPAPAPVRDDSGVSQPDAAGRRIFLPAVLGWKPGSTTGATYSAIPVEPPPTDRPADKHGDLNLALRGYSPTTATLGLVGYSGATDPGAPQMPGIFVDNRMPTFTTVHRVYDWDWSCGADGCRGKVLTTYPVTLLGMSTRAGEKLAAPRRGAEIYPGGYTVLVLYAEPNRITLKYTREDNVVWGYTVHMEKLIVDANLLALYRQANAAGRKQLPALKNGQPLGLASGSEVLVAIRDCGTFMDPRSAKDWWQAR